MSLRRLTPRADYIPPLRRIPRGTAPLRTFPRSNGVARIAGVNIPTNKRVTIGLRYIYGIGPSKAAEIYATSRPSPVNAGLTSYRTRRCCESAR